MCRTPKIKGRFIDEKDRVFVRRSSSRLTSMEGLPPLPAVRTRVLLDGAKHVISVMHN